MTNSVVLKDCSGMITNGDIIQGTSTIFKSQDGKALLLPIRIG